MDMLFGCGHDLDMKKEGKGLNNKEDRTGAFYVNAGLRMKRKRNVDPLISQIEKALDLGQFISYNQSWDFVHDLEGIKDKTDDLVESGAARERV